MTTNIVKYQTDKGEIELSKETIKNYLVSGDASKVTDQELEMALRLCQYQGLNPFLREVYIVKYGTSPANIIVGKDVFVKRAKNNPKFKGFEAGVIVLTPKGGIEYRNGSLFAVGKEELIGGWAKVYIEGWEVPFEHTVSFAEYNSGQSTWKKIPGTMIRKVALVQALREAFPDDFQGLYDSSEMGVDLLNTSGEMQAALSETRMKHHGIYGEEYITPLMAKELNALAVDKSIISKIMASRGYERMGEIKLVEFEELKEMVTAMNKAFALKDEKLPFEPEDADVEVLEEE